MRLKKAMAFICSIALVFGLCAINSAADGTPSDIQRASSGEQLSTGKEGLLFDKSTGEFTVTDNGGFVWKSSPVSGGFDETAQGMERTTQRSVLLIKYMDDMGNLAEINSFLDCQTIKVKEIDNGVRVTYIFEEAKIVIPVELTYSNHCFTASVKTEYIRETGTNKLLTVTILPYFGAGSVNENGYVLIPDGSGAVIDLSQNNAYKKSYLKPVYGENLVLYKNTEETVEKQIYLPVFGIKRESNAFLGIITEGDGISAIRANAASSYITASAAFNYRQDDSSHLQEGSSKEKEVEIVPKTATKSDFTVQYSFINGSNANYIGMAEEYRNYLYKTGISEEKNSEGISTDLSFTATAEISKSFFGIPYTGLETLTDFSDLEEIISELEKENCDNVNISLKGAFSGGIYGKLINKVSLIKKVGSIKEYGELKGRLEESGGHLYLLSNFNRVYKSGNGISFASQTARDVAGAISKQYNYYPEIFGKNEDRVWRLINASGLEKITKAFAKSADGKDISFGVFNMADTLYGDYRLKNTYDRQDMLEEQKKAYERLSDATGELYVQGANSYVLKYAKTVSGIPNRSSGYDMFTGDVPFYQAVLHGITDYSAEPVNLSGNAQKAILNSIEYGAAIRYDLICSGKEILDQTSETQLFSSIADEKLSDIIKTDKSLSDFYKANKAAAISGHIKIAEGVYRTEYENGNRSYVNYSDTDYTSGGITVKAGSYLLEKGDKS